MKPRRHSDGSQAGANEAGREPVESAGPGRSATGSAGEFLERSRRRARGTLLAGALAAALLALALLGAARLGWLARAGNFAPLALLAAAGLLAAWGWRGRRLRGRGLARGLDERWALRARLESAVELENADTALAVAQRADAARQLAGRSPPGGPGWAGACVLLVIIAVGLLSEGAVLGWRGVKAKWAERKLAAAASAGATAGRRALTAARAPDAPAVARARASIEWKAPESEITATAIEEVPLVAWWQSEVAARAAALELVVNGERVVSRPLDAAAWGAAAQPGGHELRPSVYLDELGVKPFDLVSYRIVVELAGPAGGEVRSAPQFVQIRSVRRDVALRGGSSELVELLMRMKGTQLGLLKQNIALTQLAADGSDPSWATENARVATEQTALAAVADRAAGLARTGNPPPLVTRNLAEARDLMTAAGGAIGAGENPRAAPLQERTLARLTELQQFMQPALEGGAAAADPFADRGKFELPARAGTPAGGLEALAERQRTNNGKLADGDSGAGVAQEQAAIAGEVGALGAGGALEPDVASLLRAAGAAAGETAAQLAANDPAAARVPAAAAERALDQALAVQEKLGRASAAAALDRLRRRLNAAGREASAGEMTGTRREWRTALRALATAQQRTGSALAARELAALDARSAAPLPVLARAAAQTQVLLMPRSAALTRAIRPLRRVGGELAQGAGAGAANPAGLADGEIASQEAEWLTTEAATGERARTLAAQVDALLREKRSGLAAERAAGGSALELAAALESGAAAPGADAALRSFNPADIDPRYRAAVANYFERLSREPRRPPATEAR